MKKLLGVVFAAALFAGVGGIAQAAPLGDGTLSIGETATFSGQHAAGTGFVDTYEFTIDNSPAQFGANATDFNFFGLDTNFFTLSLFDVDNNELLVSDSSFGSGAPNDVLSILFSGLETGVNYVLTVFGIAGPKGALYGGVAQLSAVPIPAALPLLGAGLLALGVFARRRRRRLAAAPA